MAVKKTAAATARTPAQSETVPAPKVASKAAPAAVKADETVVEQSPVEEVVAPSPVVETLQTTVAEAPIATSGLVTQITKTQAEVATHMEKITKSAEEFVAFGQGNVEAFLKSSQLLATGLQDIGKQIAATAQAQYEEAVANSKALTSVKSVKEAVELQTSLAKAAMEKALAETGKLTDASVKLAETVTAPIAARVTLAVEKFGKAA